MKSDWGLQASDSRVGDVVGYAYPPHAASFTMRPVRRLACWVSAPRRPRGGDAVDVCCLCLPSSRARGSWRTSAIAALTAGGLRRPLGQPSNYRNATKTMLPTSILLIIWHAAIWEQMCAPRRLCISRSLSQMSSVMSTSFITAIGSVVYKYIYAAPCVEEVLEHRFLCRTCSSGQLCGLSRTLALTKALRCGMQSLLVQPFIITLAPASRNVFAVPKPAARASH